MQEIIVALIVMAATWVVVRKYLPPPMRRRTAAVSARLLRRAKLIQLAGWLETDLPAASTCADGCGSCGNCAPTVVVPAAATAPPGKQFSITPAALKQTIRRT